MIDWVNRINFKAKSLNNKVIKESKQEEVGRENTNDYIRSNKRIHYIDD
jgi:hypothetical protein